MRSAPAVRSVQIGNRVRDVTPSASRLTTSLRDIGYDPPTAIADLVDNSLDAEARRIGILISFEEDDARVLIADDGAGMTPDEVDEALRFGSRRQYRGRDLGRFGLGLKTASLSLGRRLTVATRSARRGAPLIARTLCLDHIDRRDRWEILEFKISPVQRREYDMLLRGGAGTIVVIENLDRLLEGLPPGSAWAQRRMNSVATRTAGHLGMVFHRFLDGSLGRRVKMKVNEHWVRPWNPFAITETGTTELAEQQFELEAPSGAAAVRLLRFVLPPRGQFSTQEEFERMSGPLKWNRQQGFYVYRENRMIQSGGWCGLRAPDEHTKLARLGLFFPSSLDDLFQVNVAKMRVSIPAQLRKQLEGPVHELCQRADAVYRSDNANAAPPARTEVPRHRTSEGALLPLRELSLALTVAAIDAGEFPALERIIESLRVKEPGMAAAMGWAEREGQSAAG